MSTAAQLIVKCLENEGVEVVFGLPGEENIRFVQALASSNIRYVLTRHEQAASFMAEMYGRVTGRAAVVSATLGPGAINMQLGVADATTNSTPMVAISAQVGQNRQYKESHQYVDLVSMFAPITRWAAGIPTAQAIPEMVRKAFKARRDRTPRRGVPGRARTHRRRRSRLRPGAVAAQRRSRRRAGRPPGGARRRHPARGQAAGAAGRARRRPLPTRPTPWCGSPRSSASRWPTPSTARASCPTTTPTASGRSGSCGTTTSTSGSTTPTSSSRSATSCRSSTRSGSIPKADKKIIHIHRFPAEVDAHYSVDVGIIGDISESLDALAEALDDHTFDADPEIPGSGLLGEEFARGQQDSRYPLAPAAGSRRHPCGAGPQRRRAGRHRRHQDVDGPALSDLRAQHLPDIKWLVHHEFCAARSAWGQVGTAGGEGAGRGRSTARS